jgi:hypothetical protein
LAFADTTWYANAGDQSTTGYYAVAKWATGATIAAGALRRQNTAPAVGSERVFVCIVAGTTHATTEPTWVLTRGAKTTDNTVTWQECTGASAINGDLTNTANWTAMKALSAPTLGAIIQRNNGASYWICTTAGTMGASEPAWPNNTAGSTQADGTTTWTCLGVVGNFTGGQAPHARLANACAANWFAAGNTVYVGDNHAESQATAITIAPAGSSLTTVGKIICHNHSGSYPPGTSDLTAGASISTTAGVNITFNPTGGGSAFYLYGISFVVGAGSAGVASYVGGQLSCFIYFDRCLFKLATTFAGAALIQVSNGGVSVVTWNNCTVYFGNALHYIDIGNGVFTWQNTGPVLASGSAVPSGLLGQSSTGRSYSLTLEALDLSQITGALDKQASAFQMGPWLIKDCKLNASMTIPTPQAWGEINQLVRSDSAATAYKSTRYAYEGTETTETSITRVGGASDPTGQAQARKIVTTANGQWLRPYKAEPYAIWNPTTGTNVTVTVYGTVNAGTLPNNDDIWLEVEYLGSAASPLGTIVTTTKANLLAANAAVAADSSTWNVPGYTNFSSATATSVVVSNSNLTATHADTTADVGARSTDYKSTGKYYFEVLVGAVHSNTDGIGITTAAATYPNMTAGGVNGGVVYFPIINNTYSNGSGVSLGYGAVAGDTMCFAYDADNNKLWIRKNNGQWNLSALALQDPANNIGGVVVAGRSMAPVVSFGSGGAVNDAFTAKFGPTFIYTPPSGFGGWAGASFTPFKLTTTLSSPQPGLAGYIHARVRAAKPSTTYYLDPKVVLS